MVKNSFLKRGFAKFAKPLIYIKILFYLLLKAVELGSVKKLCKGDFKTVTYLLYCREFRVIAYCFILG